MSDVLNSKPAFAGVFTHPPLLSACVHFFGEQFNLSSFLCRTLRANTPSQDLHADLRRDSDDAPLLGFILMIDQFHESNGATRFVPGSHRWSDLPSQRMSDVCATYPGEVLGYGTAGTMILFNGATWHGHTANSTVRERRSIQGCFVRRSARAGFDFCEGLLPASRMRLNPLQRYLPALED
jgi:ectoine hydroxylase-related dioxygenase (phytanoyl-CoA dioxygenase family)